MKYTRKFIAFLAVFLMIFGNSPITALACGYSFKITKQDSTSKEVLTPNQVPDLTFTVTVLSYTKEALADLGDFSTIPSSAFNWSGSTDKNTYTFNSSDFNKTTKVLTIPYVGFSSGIKLIRITEGSNGGSSGSYNIDAPAQYYVVAYDNTMKVKSIKPNGDIKYDTVPVPNPLNANGVSFKTIDEYAGSTSTTFSNSRKPGAITVTKSVTGGTPANGTEFSFSLYQGSSATAYKTGKVTWGSNGNTLTFSDLPWGTYRIVETGSSDGYTLDTNFTGSGYSVVVDGSHLSIPVSATNSMQKGSITLTKSVTGGTPANGTEFSFSLYQGSSTTAYKTGKVTWGSNGNTLTFSDLPWGTYRIVETGSSDGYTLDSNYTGSGYSVAVDGSHLLIPVSATNTMKTGSVTITKSVTGGTPANGTEFSFSLYQGSSASAYKTGKVTWGSKGNTLTFSDLPWGTYRIVETGSSDGYTLDPNFTGSGYSFTVDSTHLSFPISATNTMRKGSITLTKSVTGGTPANGTEFSFSLYQGSSTTAYKTGKVTWGSNGNTLTFDDLPWGTYRIVETGSSDGYTLDSNFTGNGYSVDIDGSHLSVPVSVNNTMKKGSVTITKSVTGGTPTNGTEFQFSLYQGNSTTAYRTGKVTWGSNGNALTFGDLPWGTYRIVETSAPVGYTRDSSFTGSGYSFTVDSTHLSFPVSATNMMEKGSITITKSVTGGTPANGTEFQFSLYQGNSTTAYRTGKVTWGSNGNALTFGDLPWGAYRIVETGSSDGYTLDSNFTGNGYSVDIDGSHLSVPVSANNTMKKGSVTITKSVTGGTPADGTEFEFSLYQGDGTTPYQTGKVVWGTNGNALTFGDLPWGTYRIVETSAPAGYTLDTTFTGNGYSVDIDGTHLSIPVSASNAMQHGSITLTKSVTGGIPAKGTEFEFSLYQGDGTTPYQTGKVVWGTNGNALTFGDLPWGTYRIVETSAPAGYTLDTTFTGNGYSVDIDGTHLSIPVSASNAMQHGSITLTKSVTGGIPANGTEFEFSLYQGDNATPYQTGKVVWGSNGNALTFGDLPWGAYRIVETSASEGYQLDSNFIGNGYSVDIDGTHLSIPVSVVNHKPLGSISVHKTVNGSDSESEDSFTFTLYQKEDGQYKEFDHFSIGNGDTGKFTNLEWGEYYLKETNLGSGYRLLSLTSADSYTTLTEDGYLMITVNAKQQDFAADAINEKLGSLKLTKTVQGAPADDTTKFTLTVTGPNDFSQDVELANNGSATLTNLEWGTYTITEKSVPTGYQSLSGTLSATIGYAGQDEVLQLNPEVTYENMKLPTIHILKLDNDTKKPVANVTFEIKRVDQPGLLAAIFGGQTWRITTDANGLADLATTELVPGNYLVTEIEAPNGYVKAVAQPVTLVAGQTAVVTFYNDPQAFLQLLKTDADTGKALGGAEFILSRTQDFANPTTVAVGASGTQVTLVPGSWYIKETKAPAGYELNTNTYTVTLELGKTASISIPDKLIVGALRLIKVDATNQQTTLPGAAFNIYSDEARTKLAASGLTDSKGEINVSNLVPGTYWVVETSAPTGYKLNATPVSVAITANNLTIMTLLNTKDDTKEFNDEKAILKLLKVDGYSQKALEGAKFNLYSDSTLQTLVATGTTDVNGLIEFKDLTPGTYYAKETAAPKGYKLNSAPISVVTEAAKTSTLTISNELDDTKDYQTGSMDYNILIGGGMALLLGGLLVLFTRRRNVAKHSKR